MSDEKDLPPKMRPSAQAAPAKPKPRPQDPVEQEFWNRYQDGNLYFQQCEGCGSFRHLPRYMCARCGSPEWSWERSTGNGTLFSWTVTHQALHPAFAGEENTARSSHSFCKSDIKTVCSRLVILFI